MILEKSFFSGVVGEKPDYLHLKYEWKELESVKVDSR